LSVDSSTKIVAPAFLVDEGTYSVGCERIIHFLDNSDLVKYDNIEFDPDQSCSALERQFWQMLESTIEKNRQSILGLIDELQKNGYSKFADLSEMKQGYESKIMHILVHLLDGFIGIDSSFYNIIEDSHQVSDSLRQKIERTPEKYQLIQVSAENLWTFL
jgi:hypothetical protein